MKSFTEYLLEQQQHGKPWHASKSDILEMWQNLKPGALLMTPVPTGHKGTRFRMDGIRITGSSQFINSVMARLKDVIAYENNPGTRLDVEYRQIETKGSPDPDGVPDYVFYCHVEQDMKKAMKPVAKLDEPIFKKV